MICNRLVSEASKAERDIAGAIGNAEGLFMVRLGAHVCKQNKQTFEGKAWDSVDDVVRAFRKDVFDVIGEVGGCSRSSVLRG